MWKSTHKKNDENSCWNFSRKVPFTIYCRLKFYEKAFKIVGDDIRVYIRFAGISSITYIMRPPPFSVRSSLNGVENPAIRDYDDEKYHQFWFMKICNKSILPAITSASISNLFLMLLILIWAKNTWCICFTLRSYKTE